jgi:hypothetical protein
LSLVKASPARLVRFAPPYPLFFTPIDIAAATEAVMECAKSPAVWIDVEEGALLLHVIRAATLIAGHMVEREGGATLAREVARAIAGPASPILAVHAGFLDVHPVLEFWDRSRKGRRGLHWRCSSAGRVHLQVQQRS